jgi:Zn-dependent protease
MLLNLLRSDPWTFVLLAVVLIYSLALHELGHAWVAERFGDKTARNLGRVTLNPLKHLDPLGTILLLIVGFGWAKPVPINPENFKPHRLGMFCVALAGVAVNFLIAILALVVLAALGVRLLGGQLVVLGGSQAASFVHSSAGNGLLRGLVLAVRINLILLIFNLFPIPPLDGSKVVQAFAPASWQRAMWQLQRYGFFIVVIILLVFRHQVQQLLSIIMGALMGVLLR